MGLLWSPEVAQGHLPAEGPQGGQRSPGHLQALWAHTTEGTAVLGVQVACGVVSTAVCPPAAPRNSSPSQMHKIGVYTTN